MKVGFILLGSSERSLQIVILDVNEHAPQLTPESAALHILENSAPNTLVGRLSARDADSAPDGSPARDVVFALLSSSAHSNGTASAANDSSFALWRLESDGRLYALQSLDRERVSTYRLRVRLLDAGGLNSSATLLLNVDDVDDNPPEFSNHRHETGAANSHDLCLFCSSSKGLCALSYQLYTIYL